MSERDVPIRARSGRPATRGRLTRSAEFERVYRQGRSTGNRHLVLYAFANPGADGARLGLSVSRKVGGAVERNRVKRVLREAFFGSACAASGEHDVVLVARPPVLELLERDGIEGVRRSLSELAEKAGLSGAAAAPEP